MRSLLTLTALGALALAGADRLSAQVPAGFAAAWQPVAQAFHRQATREGVVGAALWFLRGDSVLAREHHGLADQASGRPIDGETIFHWASITKTVTGIAIMQLRDRGRLSLDDPIVRYVPELRQVHNPYGDMAAVTIRQLMSHSAGFRGGTWPWGGDQPWHPYEPTEWIQLVAMLPYTEIRFPPGSRYAYSNLGVVFLGRVIEALSGDDYEVYVDKNILKPLGMAGSYFDQTPYHLLSRRANSYTVSGDSVTALGLDFDTGITVSNGGLNAPLVDMAKYLAFLAGAGDPARNEGVLKRASLEEMWRPVLPAGSGAAGAEGLAGWTQSIGLSFFVLERAGARLVGHTGSQHAFISSVYLDPAAGTAAIMAFNTVGDPRPATAGLMRDVTERVFAAVFPLFR